MFPRNLTLFVFPTSMSRNDLALGLAECALKPVGPLELSSRGFVSPYGADSDELSATSGDATWLVVGSEDKLLPGAVVAAEVGKRVADIEAREGRKPGGRTRKRIKDEVIADLLPRAFVRPGRVDAWMDFGTGLLAVASPSRRVAEGVVSEIRRAMGSFPALSVNAEIAPRSVMTGWLAGDPLPEGLSLGDECELRDPLQHGGRVRIADMELQGEEVRNHLEAGKQVTQLALVLDDRVSFVFGEDLVLRKFRLLDGAVDALESEERDDLRAELDARFALLAGELRRTFGVLRGALQISKAEG